LQFTEQLAELQGKAGPPRALETTSISRAASAARADRDPALLVE
jgi:hypothetical protein